MTRCLWNTWQTPKLEKNCDTQLSEHRNKVALPQFAGAPRHFSVNKTFWSRQQKRTDELPRQNPKTYGDTLWTDSILLPSTEEFPGVLTFLLITFAANGNSLRKQLVCCESNRHAILNHYAGLSCTGVTMYPNNRPAKSKARTDWYSGQKRRLLNSAASVNLWMLRTAPALKASRTSSLNSAENTNKFPVRLGFWVSHLKHTFCILQWWQDVHVEKKVRPRVTMVHAKKIESR